MSKNKPIEMWDRVIVVSDSRRLTGVIVGIATNPDLKLKVRFDEYLIPPEMYYKLSDLELYEPRTSTSESDCDCGVKHCRDGGIHSDWCKTQTLPRGRS